MAMAQTARPLSEVPFVDLTHMHAALKDRLLSGISDLLDSNAYINGPQVEAFERAFAAFCGRAFCAGVASGLDALRLALTAGDLEPGDEVIVPANTFFASASAVVQAGGKPVFVDVSERDYNLDPIQVEAALTPKTRFLLPVHLFGQMADMRGLGRIALRYELGIVEDACQAHGAVRDGLTAGATSTAAAFSFYPTKNLGALGDAGALVTDDAELIGAARALREHGQRRKNHHELMGYTARLDTIHAIVLLEKLPLLEHWNELRRKAAHYYDEALDGIGDLELLPVPAGSRPVWHLYPIRTAYSDDLERFLHDRCIGTGRHYPEPVHLAPAFAHLGHQPGSFPVAERLARECITLAIFPGITDEQLEGVVRAVRDFFEVR
jgi:dTDP-3-amino-3,4,6-trideoxy-alpha-D-glucose transaminase